MHSYDLIVIGSGPGGYRAAVLSKSRGLSVAIIEKAAWGGTCLNRGCVPKKDWHHTAKLVANNRHALGRGIVGVLQGDLTAAWQHQHEVVNTIRENYTEYFKRTGIATWSGAAMFVDSHIVQVNDEQLTGAHIIIATGSHPHVPALFPLTPGRILTTDDLFDAHPPAGRKVAMVGSGVIGTEFSFILSQLGCSVLWLSDSAPLSRTRFSSAALSVLDDALTPCAITRYPRPQQVQVVEHGVVLTFPDGRCETVAWVLLGTGRVPHIEGLNLAAAGVGLDVAGRIAVDAQLRTSAQHIYAIGDVANPYMTANHAMADADKVVDAILSPDAPDHVHGGVPDLVYSAIELGRVGLDEDSAIDEGYEPAVGFAAFETNPRALGQDDSAGFVRLIADMDSGELLGAEVIGSEAGEIIHLISGQLGHEDALYRLASTHYNHPARAEEVRNAAETLAAKWGLQQQVFGD